MEKPDKAGATILLVDDDSAMTVYLRTALELSGYRVLIAHGGADGVRCFQMHRSEIRLVLADMIMPDMSGIDMVKTLRRQRQGLQVIFISGLRDWLPDWARYSCGLLTKPFTIPALVEAIEQRLCLSSED